MNPHFTQSLRTSLPTYIFLYVFLSFYLPDSSGSLEVCVCHFLAFEMHIFMIFQKHIYALTVYCLVRVSEIQDLRFILQCIYLKFIHVAACSCSYFLTCEIIICVYTTINGPILLLRGIYVLYAVSTR